MEKITIPTNLQRHKLNENWEIAVEIAKLTNTEPKRWLRIIKKNVFAVNRAIIDYKELNNTEIKSKVGFFTYLFNKYNK